MTIVFCKHLFLGLWYLLETSQIKYLRLDCSPLVSVHSRKEAGRSWGNVPHQKAYHRLSTLLPHPICSMGGLGMRENDLGTQQTGSLYPRKADSSQMDVPEITAASWMHGQICRSSSTLKSGKGGQYCPCPLPHCTGGS